MSVVCLSLLALASTSFATPLSTPPYVPDLRHAALGVAPLMAVPQRPINNSYIVMLKPGVSDMDMFMHLDAINEVHAFDSHIDGVEGGMTQVYNSVIKGYAGMFTQDTLNVIRSMPEVDYVEHDQVVHTMDIDTQKFAPWGLARVSHRPKLTLGTFTVYEYDPNGGEGVDVYVIDTGINVDHVEFQGRAKWGKTIPANDVDEDANGHGTHCAGTIASRAYGVAKAANVIAVKVLGSNGSGSMSDVVAGVAWASDQASKKDADAKAEYAATGKTKHKGSVANMSLGGGKSKALDQTVNAAVDKGLHFAVAAGNDNRDACDYSPAAAEKAVTVGASTLTDERAYFSNHGPCVDIFAPGLNIKSTWIPTNQSVNTISGTSMASPHTAGMLAYLLSIYGSATFQPRVEENMVPPALQESATVPSFSSMYSVAHAFLPGWISCYMPSPDLLFPETETHVAPVPKSLSPAQLKKALIALGSPDLLTDIDGKTANILIFNNATVTKQKFNDAAWWAAL